MSETTPRQVLYALVAVGFVVVVVVLTIGAAAAGLVPTWWSWVMALAITSLIIYLVANWRRTAPALLLAIGLFAAWTVGTLILAN